MSQNFEKVSPRVASFLSDYKLSVDYEIRFYAPNELRSAATLFLESEIFLVSENRDYFYGLLKALF